MSWGRGGSDGNWGGEMEGAIRDGDEPSRLVDEPARDARTPNGWAQVWAVDLLRRTPAHRPPLGRKQRVRVGLTQAGRRRPRLVLRPAIAVVVLVGFGAVASAALGRWPALVSEAYHRLIAPAPTSPTASSARAGAATRGRIPSLGSDAISAPGPEAKTGVLDPGAALADSPVEATATDAPPAGGEAQPVVGPAPARAAVRSTSRVARHGSPPSPLMAAAARPPGRGGARPGDMHGRHLAASAMDDDTAPVLEAMHALRVEGNPARARTLLAQYLDRNPQGTLAEEALAISIEAANAQPDGSAGALARKYLRLYPTGHFSKQARDTLASASPATASGAGN